MSQASDGTGRLRWSLRGVVAIKGPFGPGTPTTPNG